MTDESLATGHSPPYPGGMITITIDELPDEVAAELTVRATRRGQSVERYVREYLVEVAGRPDNAELVRLVRERKSRFGTAVSAEDVVRDIHDERERRGVSRERLIDAFRNAPTVDPDEFFEDMYGDGPDALDDRLDDPRARGPRD